MAKCSYFFGMPGTLLAGALRRHASAPEVKLARAARLLLRFEKPPTYETDGEWREARSAELVVETLPSALSVLVPA